MGYTSYDTNLRSARAVSSGFHTKSAEQIFTQSQVHESMNPKGVAFRECRDSKEHPNTIAVILAMDETGSMGRIPHHLVKDGLPHIMETLIGSGLPDITLCFMGVGDHKTDTGPLQVGQFESGDKELDHWLTNTWLEANGGGNGGESYFLPWYFAARHTKIDCYDKRGKKGFLFTIGDERCHKEINASQLSRITGGSYEGTLKANELLEEAKKHYDVYHLYIESGHNCFSEWKERLGNNAVKVDDWEKIPEIVAGIICSKEGCGTTVTPTEGEKPTKITL